MPPLLTSPALTALSPTVKYATTAFALLFVTKSAPVAVTLVDLVSGTITSVIAVPAENVSALVIIVNMNDCAWVVSGNRMYICMVPFKFRLFVYVSILNPYPACAESYSQPA